MPETTAALLADELTWIVKTLKRYIQQRAKQLEEVEEGELVQHLADFSRKVSFLNALLAAKAVRVEDRMDLVRTLRDERSQLSPMWTHEAERRSEIDFIDGFLKRLSHIDWESMGMPDMPYSPAEVYRSFRITEVEASVALRITSSVGIYDEAYESLTVGSTVTCTLEEDDSGELGSSVVIIRITRICPCESRWSEGDTGGSLFEGDIVSAPSEDFGDEAFGFLFPGGHTAFMGSSPDSDYAHRHICAGLVLLRAEID